MSNEHVEQEQEQEQEQPETERIIKLIINLPSGSDKIELPVSILDKVLDVTQTLGSLSATQEFTSYNFKLNGGILSQYVSIGEIIAENQEVLTLELSPAPYNESSAREHVLKIREISALEISPVSDIYGVSTGASSFSKLGLDEIKKNTEEKVQEKEISDEKKEVFKVTEEEKHEISQIVDEIVQLKPNVFEFAGEPPLKLSPALRSLFISQWTPSTNASKLKGDLFYLQAQTLEGETFNITAHVSGFYVNSSSSTRFNDGLKIVAPLNGKSHKLSKSHSLLALLKSLSSKFEEQLNQNMETLTRSIAETFALPTATFLSNPWLVKQADDVTPDLARTQENYLYGGLDGADLQKDWNTEFQSIKEFPKPNTSQRVVREQLLIKATYDFTVRAIKGAMAVIRDEITPMNPEEDKSQHIFLRNGIFYSKGIDATGQFAELGGDEASRAAASRDLAGVKYLNKYDIDGVYNLLTTVVDYFGHRIICQSPVPGIFDDVLPEEGKDLSDAPKEVTYGTIGDGSDIVSDEKFCQKFKNVGAAFHLKPHKAWTKDGSKVVDVVTSAQTKGMKGSDNRDYIIDLYRTTPLDIGFIEKNWNPSSNLSYPHREVTLRHEAVAEWWRREISVAVKKETKKLEKAAVEKKAKGEKVDESEKPTIAIEPEVFSLNPDAFSLSSAPTKELADILKSDEEKVREVSEFVTQILIPEFVNEMETNEVYNAIDGDHLSAILHQQGINIRYLGAIADLAKERKTIFLKNQEENISRLAKVNEEEIAKREAKLAKKKAELEAKVQARKEAAEKGEPLPELKEEDDQETKEEEDNATTAINTIPVPLLLDALYEICIHEMIARGTKHYLRKQLANLPLPLAPYVISHIHNCLLASKANPKPEAPKLDSLLDEIYGDINFAVLNSSSADIIAAIEKEVFVRFRFTLPTDWALFIKTIPLMKSIAKKFGIQWRQKQYAFTKKELDCQVEAQEAVNAKSQSEVHHDEKKSKKKGKKSVSPVEVNEMFIQSTTFNPKDILCLIPIIKDSIFESTTIQEFWQAGVAKINEKETTEGLDFLNQAIQMNEQLLGLVHPVTASSFSQLGQTCLNLKLTAESVTYLRKAFQIFERTSGIDSYQTVLSLSSLSLSELSNGQVVDALKINKRLLNHWITSFDEFHPNVITIFSSIAVILQQLHMNSESIKIFTKALELSEKSNGESSQLSGFLRFQLGQLLAVENKYKPAAEECNKAYEIFRLTLGLKDKSTIEAKKWADGLFNYSKYLKFQAKENEVKLHEAKKLEQLQSQQQIIRTNSKKNTVAPNPEIAGKSVDDIMKFINGNASQNKKNKKKKNSKK